MRALLSFLRRFFRELLLQSGQFALFYLLVQFSLSGTGVFTDVGHASLLAILAIQTSILVLWGDLPWVRFFGSLLAPLCYSFLESLDGNEFLLNSAHAGFWVFSITTGALQALVIVSGRLGVKAVLEFALTFLNVTIFLVLYFYFDTLSSLNDTKELTLGRIFTHWGDFVGDPTHIYVLSGGVLLAASLAMGRTTVLRLKERLNLLFGQYVDQSIRDEILSGRGTESRQVDLAVLFSDLRDFTSSSEHADPKAVTAMLNLYFSRWTTVVRKHGGVVDKFIGDAVMVIFGLQGEEGACEAAAACGREMLEQWPSIRDELVRRKLPAPNGLGIGLHYGPAVVGDIGSEERRNFTVIGDTVNTASRLESASKSAGRPFLLSSAVKARLAEPTAALCKPLGALSLKGREDKIEVWSLGS